MESTACQRINYLDKPVPATRFEQKASCSRADMVFFLWAASDCPEPEPQDLPFTDVPASAPYYKAVLWALQQQIVAGTSATTFSPDMLCTRAHAMTILWRAIGSPTEDADGNDFNDVPCGKYYYQSVTWAAAYQITSGTSNATFSPHRTINRAEALTFLYITKGGASIAHGPCDAHAPSLPRVAGKEIIRGVYRKTKSIRSRFLR